MENLRQFLFEEGTVTARRDGKTMRKGGAGRGGGVGGGEGGGGDGGGGGEGVPRERRGRFLLEVELYFH